MFLGYVSRPEVVGGDQTWLFFAFIICSIFCYGRKFAFVVFDFQHLSKSLAGKNVSEMTCFVSAGT